MMVRKCSSNQILHGSFVDIHGLFWALTGMQILNNTLVGGLEHEFYVSIQLGISSSQLTNSYFSEG